MAEPIVATKRMIEEIFDGAAALYDRAGPSIFQQFGARLVEWMAIPSGARMLDVATGKGAALLPAAQRVGANGRVIGIDLSSVMVRESERAVHAANLSNVETRKMDAEHLEFSDDSFDVVTCAFSLFFFPSMEDALREMRRVCKMAGQVGITMWSKTPPPFAPAWRIFAEQARAYGVEVRMPQRIAYAAEEVHALLTAAGFAAIETLVEARDVVFAREDDWWDFQFTLGTRAAILRMDEPARARFREEYLAQLRPLFRADGLHLPVAVIYARASKR
jgi:ubiquinone/menaquinone biosynthesis C-methylase UbiE